MKLLRNILKKVYTGWCVFWFIIPFLFTYPLQLILLQKDSWHKYAHGLHRIWSIIFLRMFLIPLEVVWKKSIDKNTAVVYAPNHSSYIDIPLLIYSIPGFLNFVGKHDLTEIPLWGYIYKKLYIAVDRKKAESRAKAYLNAKKSIDIGRDMVIFPEGAIPPTAGREMIKFKEGPFRLAIEKQVPIIPVSMPYNHLFLPDIDGKLLVNWHPLKIVFHEPIDTIGMTLDDMEDLKLKVFHTIQAEFIHNQSQTA